MNKIIFHFLTLFIKLSADMECLEAGSGKIII